MKSELVRALVLITLVGLVTACNTVKGAGRDVQSIGRAGERALDGARR